MYASEKYVTVYIDGIYMQLAQCLFIMNSTVHNK